MKKGFNLLTFLLIILSFGCGNQKSATGGPKDEVKPRILSISPNEFQSLSDRRIEVLFSKPMDRNTILAGFSSYPPIYKKKFKWLDGNTVLILINEDLEKDTNYFIGFSTSIKGHHNNELEHEYFYTFRNGELQNNKISGRLFYEKEEDKSFPARLILMTADSTDVSRKSVTNNNYSFDNLNAMDYYLLGYIDKNENGKLNRKTEPFAESHIPSQKIASIDLNFTYQDTVKPKIKTIKSISNNQIEILFSEEISKYDSLQIISADSLKFEVPIIAQVISEKKLFLLTEELADTTYLFRVTSLEDLKKNVSDVLKKDFKGSTKIDTIGPKILSSEPRTGSSVNSKQPEILITFDEIIIDGNVHASFIDVDNGYEIKPTISGYGSFEIQIKPQLMLKNYTTYKLIITTDTCDINNNSITEDFEVKIITIIKDL